MKGIISSIIIIFLIPIWWLVGGIHLDYLKQNGISKAEEICGKDNQIIYTGYQRTIFGGFGGTVWYQCKIKDVWFEFSITRRIDNSEFQVYNFEQKTIFPNQFDIKN